MSKMVLIYGDPAVGMPDQKLVRETESGSPVRILVLEGGWGAKVSVAADVWRLGYRGVAMETGKKVRDFNPESLMVKYGGGVGHVWIVRRRGRRKKK